VELLNLSSPPEGTNLLKIDVVQPLLVVDPRAILRVAHVAALSTHDHEAEIARQQGALHGPVEGLAHVASADAQVLLVLRLVARAATKLLADCGASLEGVLVRRPAPGHQLVAEKVAVAV